MPELPEVETTRSGIAPYVAQQIITGWDIRQPQLRWAVPVESLQNIVGEVITSVGRRGKYLMLNTPKGCVLVHLGMSGSLRVISDGREPGKHDHVDLLLRDGVCLRLTDPRRFGAVLWQPLGETHPLLAHLGPEPLSDAFDTVYLSNQAKNRSVAIKQLIMNSRVVVGVGNIYANEALFAAGIDPRRAAGKISSARIAILVSEIKKVLSRAIEQGGTTLKDFVDSQGKPGYFQQSLNVYGCGGAPCPQCGKRLKEVRLGQRSTVFCSFCQR